MIINHNTLSNLLVPLIIIFFSINSIAQVTLNDSTALIAFYEAAEGENWGTENWLEPGVPVGEWEGISLSVDANPLKRVREIDVISFEIGGTLSPEIARLDSLKFMRITNSPIEGNLDLTHYSALEKLDILSCPNLRLSNLNTSNKLHTIFVHNTPISQEEISFENLENLFYLRLSRTGIDSIADLSPLTNLVTLFLAENKLSSLSGLENLTKLRNINLAYNTFASQLDLSNSNQLQTINLEVNEFTTLPILAEGLEELDLDVSGNFIPFKELEKIATYNISNLEYLYADQILTAEVWADSLAIYGKDLRLALNADGDSSVYTWYKDGTIVSEDNNIEDVYLNLESLDLHDKGNYHCSISNTVLPLFSYTSESLPIKILGEDEQGGLYFYDQLIVEYDSVATQEFRDSLRVEFDASLIDKCQCGEYLELWQFDSLAYHEIELDSLPGIPAYVSDPDEIKKKAKRKVRVNDAGYNYSIDTGTYLSSRKSSTQVSSKVLLEAPTEAVIIESPPLDEKATLILIDTGIDSIHNLEQSYWTNEEEYDLENCLENDVHGFNFLEDNANIIENENGHGTHLAGIITEELGIHEEYDIINAKVFGDEGYGELFDAICAIYYGIENHADVYNLSWGYYGAPVTILENALKRTNALVVSSAGNGKDGIGVDISTETNFQFPASFDLENMITVAAWDTLNNSIAPFSNYSDSLVHIAAHGVNVKPDETYYMKSGTSQAAAAVSAAALCLKMENPEWGFHELKGELISEVNHRQALKNKTITGGYLGNCLEGKIVSTEETDVNPVSIQIYPNPFRDEIKIQLSEAVEFISIYDLHGKRVFVRRGNSSGIETIETDYLPSGVYFVELVFPLHRIVKKLVK